MGWFRKLKATVRPRPLDSALDDELQFHIEQRTEEFVAQGMSPGQARHEAELLFGNRTVMRESARDRDMLLWLQTTLQDLRYAARRMRRRPGFAAAAVLSLALGIGANTALFSLLDSLVLKVAPIDHPERLMRLVDGDMESLTHQQFEMLQSGSRLFSGVAAMGRVFGEVNIVEGGEPRTAYLQSVSGNYFDVLGIRAARGRTFHGSDSGESNDPIAVISDAYWRTHYGANMAAIGAHLRYADRDFTVAGIAPPGFRGMFLDFPGEIWVPLEQLPKPAPAFWAHARFLVVMGRLRENISTNRAAAEASALCRRKIRLVSGGTGYSALRKRFWQPLSIVQAIAGLVLLIACANLANLMMAGAAAREGELAVRQAIGASRSRLVRQWFTESLLLSFCGAALALLVAAWLSRALLRFLPPNASAAVGNLSFQLDLRTLGITGGLAILTCLLFGLGPAVRATGRMLAPGLRQAGGLQASGKWASRALVVFEVALCSTLLLGAGLFVRTLRNLRLGDSGLVTDHLLMVTTRPLFGASAARMVAAEQALRDRAAAIPGVRAAGFSDTGILSGLGLEYHVEGGPGAPKSAPERYAYEMRISPGFLPAMGTPFVAGRDLTESDDAGDAPVAIVNETFARRFLPGTDPVGREFRTDEASPPLAWKILGVVKDTRLVNLREKVEPIYYVPYSGHSRGVVSLAVRASGDLNSVASALHQIAREIDPRWHLREVVPFREIEDRSLVVERMVADTSAAFGALALLVACVGLYGVLALGVTRRTKEIGLRMALGASRSGVRWMVLRESLILLFLGVALGLPCALAATRYVATMLYGLNAWDSVNLAVTLLIMSGVAAAAALVPALRASRVDPILALRCD